MDTTVNFTPLSEETYCVNGAIEPSTNSGWNVQMPWKNKAFVDLSGDTAFGSNPVQNAQIIY